MFNDEINGALGKLWASYIHKVDINLLKLRISFDLAIYHGENDFEKHEIIFDGVSAFFFSNGVGESRFKTETWESAELSEIYYFSTPKDHISHVHDKPGTPKFSANPNFSLEIWSTIFLIEAKNVTIDGHSYKAS